MRETVKSLKDQLARKDTEIDQLKRELKVTAEFYELWKRIATANRPEYAPVINPVYPYPYPQPYPIGPTWICGTSSAPLETHQIVC